MWTLKRANPITEDEEYILPHRPNKRTRRQVVVAAATAVCPTQRLDWEDRVDDGEAFDQRLLELFQSATLVALHGQYQENHQDTRQQYPQQTVPESMTATATTTRQRDMEHDMDREE